MTTALHDRIDALLDTDAERILRTFAKNQPGSDTVSSTTDWAEALSQSLDTDPPDAPTHGELARTALHLAADDPANRMPLDALTTQPPAEQFLAAETIGLVSAALIVLGTHVEIERDKQGRWSFKIMKPPTDTALLKSLQKRLFGALAEDVDADA